MNSVTDGGLKESEGARKIYLLIFSCCKVVRFTPFNIPLIIIMNETFLYKARQNTSVYAQPSRKLLHLLFVSLCNILLNPFDFYVNYIHTYNTRLRNLRKHTNKFMKRLFKNLGGILKAQVYQSNRLLRSFNI